MDLSKLKPTERVIEIKHPKTQEDIGVSVSILSINDESMKKIKRKIQDERIRLEQKGKTFKSVEIEENEDNLLFSAMTSWTWGGDSNYEGQKPEFNLKNVRMIFEALPWFKAQVMGAVSDEEAFF